MVQMGYINGFNGTQNKIIFMVNASFEIVVSSESFDILLRLEDQYGE
jgi:hypothetical protein